MVEKKSSALLLTTLVWISAFTTFTGCLGDDEEQQQEVDLDILAAEVRNTDVDGDPPKEGRKFLWLQVEMTNLRDETLGLTHTLFETMSEEERVYPANQSRDMVFELEPDGTDTFWLIFDLPEDFTADELLFIPYDSGTPVGWQQVP